MVAQIDKERAEYVRLFTSGMAELKTDLGRSCDTIAEQMVTRENQLLEIKKLQEKIEAIPIPLNDAEEVIVIGSDGMMNAVKKARSGVLKPVRTLFSRLASTETSTVSTSVS